MELDDAMRLNRSPIETGTILLFGVFLIALAISTPAKAQSPSIAPPPVNRAVDPRGVDVISGAYVHQVEAVAIGTPDSGGLSYQRTYTGDGWRDNFTGTIFQSGSQVIVSLGGMSEEFVVSGSTFTPVEDFGSTLELLPENTYKYQTSDGAIYYFQDSFNQPAGQPEAIARLVSMAMPNGEGRHYQYQPLDVRISPSEPDTVRFWRLAHVDSSHGYGIHLTFETQQPVYMAELGTAFTVETATAFNSTIDVCTVNDYNCTFTRTWPSATFTSTTITDQSNRITTYTFGANGITSITLPGGSSPDVSVSYSSNRVSGVTDASGTWTYAYSDSGGIRTTVVSGPLSQSETYVSDIAAERISSITNALNQTTSFGYDAQGRLGMITAPEGDYTHFTYGPRGNVTEVRRVPKPGSTLADLVVSAGYPATCTYPASCNQPTWIEHENGSRTEYTYDNTHGGVLTVTSPAPYTGADRPQTRYTYSPLYAWYKNGSGVISQFGPITLLTGISACATGTSCAGAANEVKTTITYGSTGVANNLLPTVTTSGSGNGTLSVATTMTYDPNGDLLAVDGPLSGAADRTTYRYDVARQLTGVIGPDPDGESGPGLNRAQRLTYNNRGQITLAETGTAAGGDWANFVAILKGETQYDAGAYFRPVVTRQMSAAGAISKLEQISYDAAGRLSCIALRMNPAEYSGLPSSACTPDLIGPYGPDRIVQVTYDSASRPLVTTSAYGTGDALTEAVSYTANGRVGSLTDGRGNISLMEYDGFDRLAKLRYPNAACCGTSTTDYEQYAFDQYGRPYSARNRAGDLTYFGYDALNRLVVVNAPSGTPDVSSTYDNLGRITGSGDGTISIVTNWDALSRPTAQATSGVGWMAYGYDAAGRLTRIEWPDGFAALYTHDLYGAITLIEQDPIGESPSPLVAYGWSNLGQPSTAARAGGSGASTTWSYDAWGRLSSLAHDATGSTHDLSLGFSYNPAGQIVGRTISNDTYVYTPTMASTNYANNGLNQVAAVGASSVGYDDNENITGLSGNTYGYDALSRLTSASAGLDATAFTSDPLGRLATSTVSSTTTRFQYAGAQLVAEYDGSGTLLNRYVPGIGLDGVVTSYTGSGTSNRTWSLADERGSVVALSGSTGAVSSINRYDEYGVPASGNTGRFQYTGQVWLAEANTYYYRARTYLPGLGRFGQTDPLRYDAGPNLYVYVRGDPMNLVDPLGLCGELNIPGARPCPIGEVDVTGTRSWCSAACLAYWDGVNSHLARRVTPDFPRPGVFQSIQDVRQSLPGGPNHDYRITEPVACPADTAFALLMQRGGSAPGAPAAVEGFTPRVMLYGNNPISQSVDSRNRTIVNLTLEGHRYHPGTVFIQVEPDPQGGSVITIIGVGTTKRSTENIIFGREIFAGLARRVRNLCWPSGD